MSHSSEVLSLRRGSWGPQIHSQSVEVQLVTRDLAMSDVGWSGETELLPVGSDTYSGKLVSESNRLVGHPVAAWRGGEFAGTGKNTVQL